MNLVVSYHGTKFIGWQRQSAEIESKPGLFPSVQSVLEDAATSIVDGGIICRSRHRTDRGTHALNHRCSLDLVAVDARDGDDGHDIFHSCLHKYLLTTKSAKCCMCVRVRVV